MRFETPIRVFLLTMPVVAISGALGLSGSARLPWARDPGPVGPPVAKVERVDPTSRFAVSAPGQVQSGQNTLIECEIENIQGAGLNTGSSSGRRGRSSSPSGLTIISLVPEGTYVRSGQILAEIDPSTFEEIARQLRIRVE